MKIVIRDSQKVLNKFSAMIQNLKYLNDSVSFYFKPEGLYIQCMDGNHCCLFECTITSKWFDEYTFSQTDDPSNIGISMPLFHKVINVRHDSQTLELELNDDFKNFILIHF